VVFSHLYGLKTFGELFTLRQLIALTTFADLIGQVRAKVLEDVNNKRGTEVGCDSGDSDGEAHANAIAVYLAVVVDKLTEALSSLCTWSSAPKNELVVSVFRRQAIPMVWDYAEANPFASSSGSIQKTVYAVAKVIETALCTGIWGKVSQENAVTFTGSGRIVSTDPPYYDNIGYADLSDFFYVWLRRSLRLVFPSLFATLAVPKAEELVATPYRHSGKEAAEAFFMQGMTQVMLGLVEQSHPGYPISIYYAFKQSETSDDGTANTGWESFLDAVIHAGFEITGTWPMRTERDARSISIGTNALASSIVLVCRKREGDAHTISRREFIRELKEALPQALADMTSGDGGRSTVAAVDLAQAIIGPGMAVFSKYAAVLEADGTPMTVHTALTLINTYLPGDPDEFDADTRFCLTWFEENGWMPGPFGEADVLARAKGTAVDHIAAAGVVESGAGKVRLFKSGEYPTYWLPDEDKNVPTWEATHQLIRALHDKGEAGAGALLSRMPDQGEKIRQLAYRLYTLCERKGWAEEARAYNELIDAWSGIEQQAQEIGRVGEQPTFDF
jgi:putative DNA methylase